MKFNQYIYWLLVTSFLAGCVSSGHHAPVVERGESARKSTDVVEAARKKVQREKDWRPEVHVVQKGDTLFSIAFNYGFDYHELAEYNGIKNPNLISLGQQIRLPTGSPGPVTPAAAISDNAIRTSELAPVTVVSQAAGDVPVKEQPKLVKYPYSTAAMAQIEKVQDPTSTVVPAAAKVDSKIIVVSGPDVGNRTTNESGGGPVESDEEALVWSMPTQGKLISGFSETANRKGIDIAGQLGQPVLASAPGKVVYSGSGLRGYGKLIIIKHNNTFLSAYAHNDQILVKEGQVVTRGQKIATMGNTDTEQIKLHFEVRRLGKPVDPEKYLPVGKS